MLGPYAGDIADLDCLSSPLSSQLNMLLAYNPLKVALLGFLSCQGLLARIDLHTCAMY